jgi:hypothetical protein
VAAKTIKMQIISSEWATLTSPCRWTPTPIGGPPSGHDCTGAALSERAASGTRDWQTVLPAREPRGRYAQFTRLARGFVNASGPESPDSHRVVRGLTSRPPVSPAGFPPVSRLPAEFFPFVRPPRVSLRPAFSGSLPSAVARLRFPFGSLRVPFPLGNIDGNAAAGRFRKHWSRAARTKVPSSCRDHLAWIAPLSARQTPAESSARQDE